MIPVLQLLGAGLLAGILSPLLLSFLQQRVIWRTQKQMEIKAKAFDEAMQALAMYKADAMDVELQSNKPSGNGLQPLTHLRQETKNNVQKSLAMIEAFFNEKTFIAFNAAISSGISLKTIPNTEHFERKTSSAFPRFESYQAA